MSDNETIMRGDVEVTFPAPFVALCEIRRPPNNFFDVELIETLADLYAQLDTDDRCRAIVLASEGDHFCAGANFAKTSNQESPTPETGNPLYDAAVRLFQTGKPIVSAIQGAAIGGGFGLAMSTDFRVGCPEARFSANFVKLGFTPGFGLTHILPRVVGMQTASELFMSGRRVKGEEAHSAGILDRLVDRSSVRNAAISLASSFAENAPLAIEAVRKRLRGDLAQEVRNATDKEFLDQYELQQTADFKEGIKAVAERRPGNFRRM